MVSLILNGLEAYAVLHKNIKKDSRPRKGLETYGSLFGYETKLTDRRTLYSVEIANVDTSSKQKTNNVSYNKKAIKLKAETLRSFWPHLEYLGDFHSHTYRHYSDVNEDKGYYFSTGDCTSLTNKSQFWSNLGYRMGLVVTIASLERSGQREPRWINSNLNCFEFTLGNVRLWVAGYCAFYHKGKLIYTEDNDALVLLDCPSILGLYGEHNEYGRIMLSGRKKRPICLSAR